MSIFSMPRENSDPETSNHGSRQQEPVTTVKMLPSVILVSMVSILAALLSRNTTSPLARMLRRPPLGRISTP